jgi:hypothetical protein
LCNGCYGRLLSIYAIQAGTDGVEEKVEALAALLLQLASVAQKRSSEESLRLSDSRATVLNERSLRLLATSEFVAGHLANVTELDWSAAIIGVCKAVEVEVVTRFLEPLAQASMDVDLSSDLLDKDFGRVARYCAGRSDKPPELGVVCHFLRTAANSRSRQETSPLLQVLRTVARRWPNADWLFDSGGAVVSLDMLTTQFRNRAAHTEELTEHDYRGCVEIVIGQQGMLWSIVSATTAR